MDLDAVTVEFDLVYPLRAGWDPIDRRRQLRFDEPRIRRLDADRGRFSPLKRHTKLATKPIQSGAANSFQPKAGRPAARLSAGTTMTDSQARISASLADGLDRRGRHHRRG